MREYVCSMWASDASCRVSDLSGGKLSIRIVSQLQSPK